jgi:enoyl-CoA hydratase
MAVLRSFSTGFRIVSAGRGVNSIRRALSTKQFDIKGTLLTEPAVKVGLYAEVEYTFSQDAVNVFAGLCGDNNPLHCDPAFAKDSMFGGTIVHGIFVSSLFSTLFGRSVAGSIYVSQSLAFKRPVHVGVPVTAKMVIDKIEGYKRKGQLLICSTTVKLADGTVAVTGEARVLLPFK